MQKISDYVWPPMILGPGIDKYTEKQFQRFIEKDLAPFYGYIRTMHIPYSVTMPGAWPDVTMVRIDPRSPEISFFEVKGPRTQVGQDQLLYLADLRRAGSHAYVVQPKDWEVAMDIMRNVYPQPEKGSGRIYPELIERFSMDQFTGARIRDGVGHDRD